MTVRNMESQAPMPPRPPKPYCKIDHKSDWSDSEEGKDDQVRSYHIDPKPSTFYARYSAPLGCPNTYPKVLNLGWGRGKGKFPLGNWTSVVKGHGCRLLNEDNQSQTPPVQQEAERNLLIVAPMDRIVHTDRNQTYEGDPTLIRPRNALANWTCVSLGNNPNRPRVAEITRKQLQWHIFDDNNTEKRPGQRCNDCNNRTSDDTESAEGDPIYSHEDGSRPGLEDVQWTKTYPKV